MNHHPTTPTDRRSPAGVTVMFGAVLLSLASAAVAAPTFTLSHVSLPSAFGIFPVGIGNAGRVFGSVNLSQSEGGPAVLENGVWRMLVDPQSEGGNALGMNNQGTVVGNVYQIFPQSPSHAVKWDDTGEHDLGVGSFSQGNDINEAGDIVGSQSAGSVINGIFIPHGGPPQTMNIPGANNFTQILRINNLGHMLGVSVDAGNTTQYSFFDGTTWIPMAGGNVPASSSLNDNDEAVGNFSGSAAVWRNGAWQSFLPGGTSFFPSDINNNSHIVGSGGGRARYWDGTTLLDLNSLVDPPGEFIFTAVSISDDEHILAMATSDNFLSSHWVLLSPPFTIARPTVGAYRETGQRDSVEWTGTIPGQDSVRLALVDPRTVSKTILGRAALGDGKFVFSVPEALSSHCTIRFEALDGSDVFAESPAFTVRGWDLARFDAALDEYVPYTRGVDDWNFINTDADMWPAAHFELFDYKFGIDPNTNLPYPDDPNFELATDSTFVDWPLFTTIYGIDQCYWDVTAARYREYATDYWRLSQDPRFEGSCLGFAVASLLQYAHPAEFHTAYPQLPAVTHFFDYPVAAVRDVVNSLFATQTAQQHQLVMTDIDDKTPRQTIDELRVALLTDAPDLGFLTLENQRDDGGAHAVIAYQLTEDADIPDLFYIHIANPNNKVVGGLVPEQVVIVDLNDNLGQGSWTFAGFSPEWGGTTGLYLGEPSSAYLPPLPALAPRGGDHLLTARGSARPALAGVAPGVIQLGTTCRGLTAITTDTGDSLGFVGNRVLSHLPGGRAVTPIGGRTRPPTSYRVPSADRYTIELRDSTGLAGVFTAETDSSRLLYEREPLAPGEAVDRLCVDGGLAVHGGTTPHTVLLKASAAGAADERSWTLRGLTVAGGDSLWLALDGRDRVRLANAGAPHACTLELRFASRIRETRFRATNFVCESGSEAIIAPDWNDAGLSTVDVLLDRGRDGSIDDTLHVVNEYAATGVRGGGGDGSLATTPVTCLHELFAGRNVSTRFSLSLASSSDIRLDVLDVRGRLVTTLAHGRRSAGRSDLTWNGRDGAGRVAPSGVYLVRFEARPLDGSAPVRSTVRVVRTR